MQLHSSKRQDAAASALLALVKDKESSPGQEQFRLHIMATKDQHSTSKSTYRTARRYTIDDNGGSYEGL